MKSEKINKASEKENKSLLNAVAICSVNGNNSDIGSAPLELEEKILYDVVRLVFKL